MKTKITLYTVLLSLLFYSCDKTNKGNKAIINETVKTVSNVEKAEDFRERLKAKEPATEAQFRNWLPKHFREFSRTEFTKSRISQNDIASAGAIYKNKEDNKKLEITIVDGASKDGLLAINSHYMAQNMKFNSEKGSGYQKAYENNGLKVLETYVENDSYYEIKFLHDLRFGITLVGLGLSYDELWQVISSLDLK